MAEKGTGRLIYAFEVQKSTLVQPGNLRLTSSPSGNATEALNTVIYGLDLTRGDEVIRALQDYPNIIQACRQRAQREGIVYRQSNFKFPIEDDEQIVRTHKQAITPGTKLIHVTHIINWVGQIMPVQKLCQMAHKHGVEVLIDGTHLFGLLDFKIPDLGCDYSGTSLHKFLSAPVGTRMLWIKKEKIPSATAWYQLIDIPEPSIFLRCLRSQYRRYDTRTGGRQADGYVQNKHVAYHPGDYKLRSRNAPRLYHAGRSGQISEITE